MEDINKSFQPRVGNRLAIQCSCKTYKGTHAIVGKVYHVRDEDRLKYGIDLYDKNPIVCSACYCHFRDEAGSVALLVLLVACPYLCIFWWTFKWILFQLGDAKE